MFSLNKKIQFFNMIEVLLALAVIAIGMTSVLGLFPVGLNASRNAVAENMSADVAGQMVTYVRVINEADGGTNYTANFVGTGYNASKYSTVATIESESEAFLTTYKTGNVSTGSATFPRVAGGWAVFESAAVPNQIFFVVQGPNSTEDGGNRNIDYSAMILVWKDTVQIKRLESDGSTWSNWPTTANYTYSGKVNIELSWPLELPYAERKKRYYQIIISNPN